MLYALPVVAAALAIGAWWLWRTHTRIRNADADWRHDDAIAVGRRTLTEIDAMSGTQFEELVAGLCRRDGFPDVLRVGGAGDNGADVLCTLPDGRTAVIQCKRYAATARIAPREVRDLRGAQSYFKADVAIFVTTTTFSRQSTQFGLDEGILMIHRDFLGLWNAGTPLHKLEALNGTGQGGRRRAKPKDGV